MNGDKISFRQCAAAAAVSTFSPISRLLPKSGLEVAGKSCWVGVLLSFLPLLGLCFVVKSLLSGEERGLCGAMETAIGKWPGRILSALLGLWIIFYGGFLIRSGAERYLSTVYKDEKLWFFIVTIAGVALIAALGRVRAISRMAQICAVILGLTLVVLFAFALPDMQKYYLLPVNVLDSGYIALSALPALNVATSWVFITCLTGYVRPDTWRKGTLVSWAAYTVMLMLIVIVATVGVLGPELSAGQQYPFFALISNLKIFNIFERIEPVTVMIWVLTDMVFISMLMMSAGEAGKNMTGLSDRRWPVLVCAALMTAVAFFISGSAFQLTFISDRLIPIVNLLISAVLLPLLALVKKLRRRNGNVL